MASKSIQIKEALRRPEAAVDSGLLLKELIEVWGGPRQFAVDLKNEFSNATKGSMVRHRILETIQRLVVNNTNKDLSRPYEPSELTDDELQSELEQFVERARGQGVSFDRRDP